MTLTLMVSTASIRKPYFRDSPGDILPGHRDSLPPSRSSQKRDLLIHRQLLDELIDVGIQKGLVELVVCSTHYGDVEGIQGEEMSGLKRGSQVYKWTGGIARRNTIPGPRT